MKKHLFLLILLISMGSCQDEGRGEIDSELNQYILIFEEEAELRGHQIDIDELNVSAHIMNIPDPNVLGQCFSFIDLSKEIVIDQIFWNNLGELDREYLMMHELGHCVLDRDHSNSKDQFGDCKSIMQSGIGTCEKKYNENNRTELLDELFEI